MSGFLFVQNIWVFEDRYGIIFISFTVNFTFCDQEINTKIT